MTSEVVTFSQNFKLQYPHVWFSCEKNGFEKKRCKERELRTARVQVVWRCRQDYVHKSDGENQSRPYVPSRLQSQKFSIGFSTQSGVVESSSYHPSTPKLLRVKLFRNSCQISSLICWEVKA